MNKCKRNIIILGLIALIVEVIYILKPICWDVKFYINSAHQASLLGDFPMNVFESWEQKLIVNRIVIYFIYSITSIFISFEKYTLAFSIVVSYKFIAK